MATDRDLRDELILDLLGSPTDHIAIWCEVTGVANVEALRHIILQAPKDWIEDADGDAATFFMDFTDLPHAPLTGIPEVTQAEIDHWERRFV